MPEDKLCVPDYLWNLNMINRGKCHIPVSGEFYENQDLREF